MRFYKGLQIKDGVDMNKLLDFGYKPKYDEDTGEIRYYYKYVYDHGYSTRDYNEYEIRISNDLGVYSPTEYNDKYMYNDTKSKRVKRKFTYKLPSYNFDVNPLFFEIYELTENGLLEQYVSKK